MVVCTEWLGRGCGSALGLLCSLSRDFANVPEGREAVARRPLRGVDLSVLDSELQGWWGCGLVVWIASRQLQVRLQVTCVIKWRVATERHSLQ